MQPDCQNCGGEGVVDVDDFSEATGHFTRTEPCGCGDDTGRDPDDYLDEPFEDEGYADDRECCYRDSPY